MRHLYCIFAIIIGLMLSATTPAYSQASADSYYAKAVKAQQTMTISSQNTAIKNFELAKKCYDSQSKKELCDAQIRTCRNTIKLIKDKEEAVVEEAPVVDKGPQTSLHPVKAEPVYVKITLSTNQIAFKAKGGESATVDIDTGGQKWEYMDVPAWVTVSSNPTQLVILSQPYESSEDRMGSIKIKSGDSEEQIYISQQAKGWRKVTSNVKKTTNNVKKSISGKK